ncbi:MAG: hypothetical protein AAFN74_18470, partial [Myxococcota bacterium]
MSLALLTATALVFAQIPAQSGSTFKVIRKAKKATALPASRPTKQPKASTPLRASPPVASEATTQPTPQRPPPPAVAPSAAVPAPPLPMPALAASPPPPALDPRSTAPIDDDDSPRVLPWVVLVGSGLLLVGGTVMALRTAEALRETEDIEIVFD